GLDDDALEVEFALAAALGQQRQRGAQVFPDRAADAAVGQLHDLLVGVRDQDVVVDVLLAELVLDHGDLLAVGLGEDALEQRGLARAEEAGQDGGGDELVGHGVSESGGAPGRRKWGRRTLFQAGWAVKSSWERSVILAVLPLPTPP